MPRHGSSLFAACLRVFGALICLSIVGCWSVSSEGAPVRYAIYPPFALDTQDGKSFRGISITKPTLSSKKTFKIRFPSGEESLLEDLNLNDIEQNVFFERNHGFFTTGVGIHVGFENERITYFSFTDPYDDARAAGKPAIALIYLPAGKELTFPMSREEMESLFGKGYKLE